MLESVTEVSEMRGRLAFLVVVAFAVVGPATGGVVFDNSPIRTTQPNGFVMYGSFAAADDLVLEADAVVSGGRFWTWEEVAAPAPSGLNYAFWPNADISALLPTAPAANPLPGASGTATVQRTAAGTSQVIGGIEYAPYEYLFALEEAIALPASTPLWLSFNFPNAPLGPIASYLWAYSGNAGNSIAAWGTANINDDAGVNWSVRASSGTAFQLLDQDLNPPLALPLPTALWLMLVGLSLFPASRLFFRSR
jgi:hypothetical protein